MTQERGRDERAEPLMPHTPTFDAAPTSVVAEHPRPRVRVLRVGGELDLDTAPRLRAVALQAPPSDLRATDLFEWGTRAAFDLPLRHRDVRIGGVVIPAHAQVIVSLARQTGTRRATATPKRSISPAPTGGHLALGYGIHHCLGAPLARRSDASRSPRCTRASRPFGPRPTPPSSAGGTGTDWCCAGCRSCPWCCVPDALRLTRR
jgi:hypothetical protein